MRLGLLIKYLFKDSNDNKKIFNWASLLFIKIKDICRTEVNLFGLSSQILK
jgi:hypothetical protein